MNNINKSKILLLIVLSVFFSFLDVPSVSAYSYGGGSNSMPPDAADSAGNAYDGSPPKFGEGFTSQAGLKAMLVSYEGDGGAPVQIGHSVLLVDSGSIGGGKGERWYPEEDSKNEIEYPYNTRVDVTYLYQYEVTFSAPENNIGTVVRIPGKLPSLTDDTGIANYLERNGGILDSYFGDPSKVKSIFGASMDFTQIDKYYIIFEPVYGTYNWPQKSEFTCDPNGTVTATKTIQVTTGSGLCVINHKYDYDIDNRRDCEANDGRWDETTEDVTVATERLFKCTATVEKDKLKTARQGGSNVYLRALYSGENEKNKHPARDSEGKILSGVTHFFVGPLAKNALVAADNIFNSSRNFYKIVPDYVALTAHGSLNYSSGTYAVGMGIYHLAEIMSCRDACNGLTGDGLLQCAERYCDNSSYDEFDSPTDPKGDCIMACGYTPAEYAPPMKCNSDNDPYKDINEKSIAEQSECSIFGDGTPTGNQDGISKSCYQDADGIIFDQKTYINVSCVERTNFIFTDFSRNKFVAGQGIDYNTRLRGKKECAIFFDINSWKYDFATIHSEDLVRKDRLLKLVEAYNNLLEISLTDPIDGRETLEEGKGKTYPDGVVVDSFFTGDPGIKLGDLYYDDTKVDVKSKVTEVINNALSNEGMRVYGGSSFVSLIKKSLEKSSTFVISGKDETVGFKGTDDTSWFEGSSKNNPINIKVNRYTNSSYVQKDYEYPAVCISNDGKAKTSLAPANGICYTTGNGTNVFARNSYYTSLNATSNKDFINSSFEHKFDTVATAQSDGGGNYVEETEACPYEIDDKNLECEIEIVMDGGTLTEGNDVYLNGGITAKLLMSEHLDANDGIQNFGIVKGNSEALNGESSLHLGVSDKENGKDYIDITGVVESSSGKKAVCRRRITLASSSCGSCTITKYDDKIYEITPSGGGKYYAGLSTSLNWGDMTWAEIKPREKDNKILIKVENEAPGTYVFGKISNGGCSSICSYKIDDSGGQGEKKECQQLFLPAQTGEIKEYCDSNWYNDKANYTSASDCVNRCSTARMCDVNRRDLTEVTNSCNNNYDDWGFNSKTSCINYCYYSPESGADYIYRPVNNFNPFPNSYDSNTLGFTYPTGKRIVPANWVGKTQYIKQDDDDTTSVTGQNANQRVEYIIELNPEAIREIRRDTESYNSETAGNDAYLDYIYMNGVDKTKRYYSKFINETFRSYFRMIDGVDV